MRKEGKKETMSEKHEKRPRINKRKLGMIGTKRCNRCGEYFYPNMERNIYCPYCSGKPYSGKGRPNKYEKCKLFGCLRKHFGKGYCRRHYVQLVGGPRQVKVERLKAAKKWNKKGTVMCEMTRDCEVYFIPRAKNQYGRQKICPRCVEKRDYKKRRK